jgi:hypothetical protein
MADYYTKDNVTFYLPRPLHFLSYQSNRLLRRSDLHRKKFSHLNCLNDILFFFSPKTLTFLRAKCNEKLYRLNVALILIGQFMWAEQIKSYKGNTITINFFPSLSKINAQLIQ